MDGAIVSANPIIDVPPPLSYRNHATLCLAGRLYPVRWCRPKHLNYGYEHFPDALLHYEITFNRAIAAVSDGCFTIREPCALLYRKRILAVGAFGESLASREWEPTKAGRYAVHDARRFSLPTIPKHLPREDVLRWEVACHRDPEAWAAYSDWCEENQWPARARWLREASGRV